LRLTDRCVPFRNGDPKALSSAECRQLVRIITAVAVRHGHTKNASELSNKISRFWKKLALLGKRIRYYFEWVSHR
jgi:hypothetical protein